MEGTKWVVYKFGGSSVADAECYRQVAKIITSQTIKNESAHPLPSDNGVQTNGENKKVTVAAVVSAIAGTTDSLIKSVLLAKNQDSSYLTLLESLITKTLGVASDLLTIPGADGKAPNLLPHLVKTIEKDAQDIKDVLRGVYLCRSFSETPLEIVSGYGEIWSAQILQAYLVQSGSCNATWLDARKVVFVQEEGRGSGNSNSGVSIISNSHPVVDWQSSQKHMDQWVAQNLTSDQKVDAVVVTGYIASYSKDGMPTTLKRNGSDFSASIFGALLKSASITIWKEVDGVYSADPRKVPDAVLLDTLSYDEAMELAYFGAKILHPQTMEPAIRENIPIKIRNTFKPTHAGTLIHSPSSFKAPDNEMECVKGFSTIDDIAVINVEGTGMVGVSGFAQRIFGALHQVGVSVVMISQTSSEHSVCFAVPDGASMTAKAALEKEFFRELHYDQIHSIDVIRGCSILAAVGDKMSRMHGVSGRLFSALGKAGVNIVAIAQGSNERIISVVIDQKDVARALAAAHTSFKRKTRKIMSVGIIGVGLVGGQLLRQITSIIRNELESIDPTTTSYNEPSIASPTTTKKRKSGSVGLGSILKSDSIDLRVRAISNSNTMILATGDTPIPPAVLVSSGNVFKSSSTAEYTVKALDLDEFVDHIRSSSISTHSIVVDCTASMELAKQYPKWLSLGVNVVTPNKKAFSSDIDLYKQITSLCGRYHHHYSISRTNALQAVTCKYETTVGASLPVISTLRDMVMTGDSILQIEGILSGTLSFIFNTYSPPNQSSSANLKFSDIVKQAKEKGYTEPDPRDDLNGMDVARKVCILARECGFLKVSMDTISVQNIVPAPLQQCPTAEEFMKKLPEYDAHFEELKKQAQAKSMVMRYVGVIQATPVEDLPDDYDGVPTCTVKVELREYPASHPFASLKGSDNIISFRTRRYNECPLIVQGAGAGADVTAAGVLADLLRL